MSDIIISTDKKEEQKPQESDIKEILRSADEYAKLKEDNDKLENEILRGEQLRARKMLAGKANAGTPNLDKTPEEIAKEEAKAILDMFK